MTKTPIESVTRSDRPFESDLTCAYCVSALRFFGGAVPISFFGLFTGAGVDPFGAVEGWLGRI